MGISVVVLTLVFIIRYEQSGHKVKTKIDEFDIEGESNVQKPHLITLEDLDYLFSNREENNGFLVWSLMRPFLERPDALPETGQGVEEAALAMKGLVSLINKEKLASAMVSTKARRTCPDFVNAADVDLSGSRPVLELPCGLTEDSSITLVGVPDEHSRSFQIQLVGSGILRYGVNFSKPSIVQNTWTEKLGWGEEVRCPCHGSFKNQIGNETLLFNAILEGLLKRFLVTIVVDELPLCNEQTRRITLEESPYGDAMMDDFPFLRGNPFTATLWFGLQGFHMTVNGRHETSFPYREVSK